MHRKILVVITVLVSLLVAGCRDDRQRDPRKKKPRRPSTVVPALTPAPAAPALVPGEDRAIPDIQVFIDKNKLDKALPEWRKMLPRPTQAVFAAGKKYFWDLSTSKGDFRILLHPDKAPMHATSTIYLTLLGFYDGLTIHRVNPGSTLQGGCPVGDGTGMPGYLINDETQKGQDHARAGIVSSANRGPSTDGSQFVITLGTPADDLRKRFNKDLTIFGEVVAGGETLTQIEACGTQSGATSEKIEITKATITVE